MGALRDGTRIRFRAWIGSVGLIVGICMSLMFAPSAEALATGLITYHGGHVIENVKVDIVIWDQWNYAATLWYWNAPSVVNATATMAAGPYMDRLAEYDTGKEHIRRGSLEGVYTIHPAAVRNPSAPYAISEGMVRDVLTNQFNTGNLPGPGPNRVYVIYFPSNKILASAAPGSRVCAYHQAYSYPGASGVQANKAYYAIIPYGNGCGITLNNLMQMTSHEVVETITDPGIYSSWYSAPPHALAEVADYCGGSDVYGGNDGNIYSFTQTWSDAAGRCV